jgi:hypothetical protein
MLQWPDRGHSPPLCRPPDDCNTWQAPAAGPPKPRLRRAGDGECAPKASKGAGPPLRRRVALASNVIPSTASGASPFARISEWQPNRSDPSGCPPRKTYLAQGSKFKPAVAGGYSISLPTLGLPFSLPDRLSPENVFNRIDKGKHLEMPQGRTAGPALGAPALSKKSS